MTISTETRKVQFTGNGVTLSFPFSFKVFAAADLYVVKTVAATGAETVLALTTDYTVTLNGDQNVSPGGTVTLPAALASGYLLTITTQLAYTQGVDLTNNGGFFPRVISDALDRITMLVQQGVEGIGRSLKYSVSTPSGVSSELPYPAAYKVLAWKGDLSGLENVDNGGANSLATNLAASGGSALVGFLQSGTGATARTAQAKLRESLSVLDFGAVGDGVTDDTAEISAAITAAAGKRITFPDGSYLVSTSLTIPSNTEIVFDAGAKIMAGANSLTVFTTSGFTSNIQLRNVNIDGNTKTGVTAINLSNVQFHSVVENPNVYRCQYGIKLVSTCIGVSIINPTTYDVDNGIQILASNANAIYTPSLDNSVASGGDNSGTGIFITGSSNQVYGGFVQGFQYGYYDQGDYNGVNGTYYELCTDSAHYLDGALGTLLENVFFYGYNTVAAACHLCVAVNSKGVGVMFPKMIQGNSTGGLYYFVTGNSECYEIHTTDGGTTNTNEGTRTQIAKVIKQSSPTSFTPTVDGGTVTGTGTYTTQAGSYVQHGSVVHFTINVAWSAHTGSGELIVSGLPVGASSGYINESFVATPSAFAVAGPHIRGYFSSATPHIRVVQVDAAGVVANVALPASGGLVISGTYFAA